VGKKWASSGQNWRFKINDFKKIEMQEIYVLTPGLSNYPAFYINFPVLMMRYKFVTYILWTREELWI